MKTIRVFGTPGLILILGAALGVSFASPVFAQTGIIVNPVGKVTFLGTLSTQSGSFSNAFGINDFGQVVGFSNTEGSGEHAFITGPNGIGMIDLGTLGGTYSTALGINDYGQVVGDSYTRGNNSTHAFITGPNGMGMIDLGTLGGADSTARGINDYGQVVGDSRVGEPGVSEYGDTHAFITGPNGIGMADLGILGSGTYSSATAINNAGQVVGFSYTTPAFGSYHAFITGPNGMGMIDLGTLGGTYSTALGINDSGQVVGYSTTADHSIHAFITGPNGMGMTDLGTLGGANSLAYGINDSGQVVGLSVTADGFYHAFITGPNGMGMIDLNSFADLPDEAYFRTTAINNLGQVSAIIYTSASPTPIPEPASYALMLAGLVGFMALRKKPAANIIARLKPAGNSRD